MGGNPKVMIYRIDGQYRRTCAYVALMLPMAAAFSALLPPRGRPLTPILILSVCSAMLWFCVATWRLRIDATGLSRRRFGCWSGWPWEFFQAGQVRRAASTSSSSYRCPARPWWDRHLTLEFLSERDRHEVGQFLARIVPNVEASDVEASLVEPVFEVVLRNIFGGQMHIDRGGVRIRTWGKERLLSWPGVRRVRIVRSRQKSILAVWHASHNLGRVSQRRGVH
jgi:hypothetical protein